MAIQQMLFAKGAAGDKVVATGGTVYTVGNYKVHAFTASGTFSISAINDANATLDVFLVGGGTNGGAGESSIYDFDGRNGGAGGAGGNYRTYSGLAFGTYFNAANYTVTVAGLASSSSVNNKTASAFVSSGASSGGSGGSQGYGATFDSGTETCSSVGTSGGNGGAGTTNDWTGTTYTYGAGGGGGGGGGAFNNCYPGDGGFRGNTSGGNGGGGGAYYTGGTAGFAAATTGLRRGGGGGGGGGAGSNNEDGNPINGGAGGAGSGGIVVIRYLFQ